MIIMKIILTKIFVCHIFGTIGTGYMSWHKIGEFIQVPQITVLQWLSQPALAYVIDVAVVRVMGCDLNNECIDLHPVYVATNILLSL